MVALADETPTLPDAPHAASPATPGALVVLGLALVTAFVVPVFFGDAPQDDAYIAWIYSRNWARGEGFVFNAGEPPLEGYVNFLWVAGTGVGMKLGMDPEQVVPWVGLALTLLSVLGTFALARRLGATAWFASFAALLFATRPALAVHATGGLETPLIGFLVLAAALARIREHRRGATGYLASLCLALAAMTRPEAIGIYAAFEFADLMAVRSGHGSLAGFLRRAALRAIPFVVLVGGHFLYRKATYGEFLPHVVHAKVSPGLITWADGVEYVFYGLLYFGPVFFLLPYFVPVEQAYRRARALCLWVATIYLGYPLYVGGDYIPSYRFLWPVFPLWAALAATAFTSLSSAAGGAVRLTTRAATLIFVTMLVYHTAFELTDGHRWTGMHERHDQLVAGGKKLNEILPEDAWIAATNVGRVPYFADRRTIDMLGLNDAHIGRLEMKEAPEMAGHLKGDGKYVLDQQPEIITFLRLMLREVPMAEENWWITASREAFGVSEKEILQDPRFRKEYRMYSFPLPEVNFWLNVWARQGVFDHDDPPAGMRMEPRPWPGG